MKLPPLTRQEPQPQEPQAINDGVYTPPKTRRKRGPNKPRTPPVQNANLYAPTFFQLAIGLSVVGAWATKNTSIVMSDKEAASIAEPASRLFAKSELAHRYGKIVAEGNDWVALTMACMGYGARVLNDTGTGVRHESVRHSPTSGNQKSGGFGTPTTGPTFGGNSDTATTGNEYDNGQSSTVGVANGQLFQYHVLRDE